MKPITHTRAIAPRRVRTLKTETAAMALKDFDHGLELDCLTFGQFSIIDAIAATLQHVTGPASVTLSTWTAAEFDVEQLVAMISNKTIVDFRLLIDRGFTSCVANRFKKTLTQHFGASCIRETMTHAKFCLIRNEAWNVVIRTSMNLNHNPRFEYMQVSDDPHLMAFYSDFCDQLFASPEDGLGKRRRLPIAEAGTLPFAFKPLPTWRT